jgi:spore maturation protein CgeB
MRILWSFNKTGFEAEQWRAELVAASDSDHDFVPFDHTTYLDPSRYLDAWSLDRLYRNRDAGLLRLYRDLEETIRRSRSDALVVNHCPPYHPDFLRTLGIYRVLYSSDDPDSTYKRNIPYLHAYHHVLFADPAYSAEMTMQQKMRYCGMANADWCPLGVMDFEMNPAIDEATLFSQKRDIDVIYVGSFFRQKLDLLARVKKAFGRRAVIHGLFKAKHNLYFIVRHGYPGWVQPISFAERTRLYQRAKVGFNVHWNEFGLGNQRLYFLPANGVMQISDCADSIGEVFKVGEEVDTYRNPDELIAKLEYYLEKQDARDRIARAAYRRTMHEYRFRSIVHRAAGLIAGGMERIGWKLHPFVKA